MYFVLKQVFLSKRYPEDRYSLFFIPLLADQYIFEHAELKATADVGMLYLTNSISPHLNSVIHVDMQRCKNRNCPSARRRRSSGRINTNRTVDHQLNSACIGQPKHDRERKRE